MAEEVEKSGSKGDGGKEAGLGIQRGEEKGRK